MGGEVGGGAPGTTAPRKLIQNNEICFYYYNSLPVFTKLFSNILNISNITFC